MDDQMGPLVYGLKVLSFKTIPSGWFVKRWDREEKDPFMMIFDGRNLGFKAPPEK